MTNNERLSSYTICIELENTDKIMLIHGYTGAIDIVNKNIMISLKSNHEDLSNKKEISFSTETWQKLKQRGYITTKTFQEEVLHVKKMADILHRQYKIGPKFFGFLVSYDCNFRCPYCYEAKISNFGNNWSKRIFNKTLVDDAYNAIFQIEKNEKLHGKSILLYGGEPLLKESRDIVEYIVEKGIALNHTFSAVTNGYDLEYYFDLLGPKKIASLQITIDGTRETHARTRIHKDNLDTFDKILTNIGEALKRDVFVSVRMNCNADNITEIEALGNTFKTVGFFKYKKFYFYNALIYDYLGQFKAENKEANNLEFMEREKFVDFFKTHNTYHIEDEGFEKLITKSIETGKKLMLRSIYCGAFANSYLFDSKRNIYSCWETIGRKETIVGNFENGIVHFNSELNKLHSFNIGYSDKCIKCKYVFLCRGGCPIRKKSQLCSIIPRLLTISANNAYSHMHCNK